MDRKVLLAKVEVTVAEVSDLLVSASKVNTRSRTVYYKCAVILMASILELVLYEFIERACASNPNLLTKTKWKYEEVQVLQTKIKKTGSTHALVIAERVPVSEPLKKIRQSFNSMIEFCEGRKLLDKRMCKRLRAAKDKRNELHLQTTAKANRNFNKKMVLQIVKTTTALLEISGDS